MKRLLLLTAIMSFPIFAGVNSWECGKFEGAKIIASDGTSLGKLGPKWESDSIFNDSLLKLHEIKEFSILLGAKNSIFF